MFRFSYIFKCGRAAAAIAAIALLTAAQARAGEIEPRAYMNAPIGVNFLIAGYSYSHGGLALDASVPMENASLTMHTALFAYATTLDVWGRSGKIDLIVPYTSLSGSALVFGEPRERKVSGISDPRLRFSVGLIGAPSLSLKDFTGYRQDLIVGLSFQVSAPLGQYDPDKLVNLGTNRWYFKPDLGISKAWGPFALELSAGVFFMTTNNDYYGGKTLGQAPLWTGQIHATYNFGKGVWGAVSSTYDYGGQTTVNGVEQNDMAKNSRYGATFAIPVNRNNSIKLLASSGVYIRTGTDYSLYGIVWQYRWGGGL